MKKMRCEAKQRADIWAQTAFTQQRNGSYSSGGYWLTLRHHICRWKDYCHSGLRVYAFHLHVSACFTHHLHGGAAGWVWLDEQLAGRLSETPDLRLNSLKWDGGKKGMIKEEKCYCCAVVAQNLQGSEQHIEAIRPQSCWSQTPAEMLNLRFPQKRDNKNPASQILLHTALPDVVLYQMAQVLNNMKAKDKSYQIEEGKKCGHRCRPCVFAVFFLHTNTDT